MVNLGYVLNVIEEPRERARALSDAFALARGVLIVAVRADRTPEGSVEYGDGCLTGAGTFQKIFTQTEFVEYVQSTLAARVHVASMGIIYVFRNEDEEARFVANRAFSRRLGYRRDLIEQFSTDPVAQRYVKLANRLGRAPRPAEFPKFAQLVDSYGSAVTVERLLARNIDAESFAGSRAARQADILTYFAMLRLQGLKLPPFHSLDPSICADIKSMWKSYAEAAADGEQFLFKMGSADRVCEACSSAGLGKLLPGHLYVHRSALDELPPLLRVLLFAAQRVVGAVPFDIAKIKIARDGRAISFLLYDDFDGVPHPALVRSVRVYLPRAAFSIREYASQVSGPILHRKDAFVLPSYALYPTFRRLTEAEEALGLLSQPDIGTRQRWEQLLSDRGLAIADHRLEEHPSRERSAPIGRN